MRNKVFIQSKLSIFNNSRLVHINKKIRSRVKLLQFLEQRLQSGAGITKWGKGITKWGKGITKWGRDYKVR